MSGDERAEVVCLGEAMAQLTARPPDRLEDARLLALGVAGAEMTVALYLAQLGHRVSWVSRVGHDPFGTRILGLLAKHGVDTTAVVVDPERRTGLYLKDPTDDGTTVYYYRAGSAAAAMRPEMLAPDLLNGARIVHLTGITPALSPECARTVDHVIDVAAQHRCSVSVDVNLRQKLWAGRDAAVELRDLANRADVCFVGLDEAESLWGSSSPGEVRETIDGPCELVVKDGARGATVFVGGDRFFAPAGVVDVVEAVGAGDSFAAGYLHQRLLGRAPGMALEAGHALAARALRSTDDFVDLNGGSGGYRQLLV